MPSRAETALLTALALLAFAGNSLLTRSALGAGHIDAAAFTAIRLLAGAIVLVSLAAVQTNGLRFLRGATWAGPAALFAYAAPFSFAYVRLGAALGALVLFASVQLTMLTASLLRREKLGVRVWLGLSLALAGLAGLSIPAATRPDPVGTALMISAGMAWAIYTTVGKRVADPLQANARSFAASLPLVGLLLIFARPSQTPMPSSTGVGLAMISGALTSGLGYALWYRALRGLTGAQAAVIQLTVPIWAATGAVLLLGETLSVRLLIAGAAVLGGVALAVLAPKPRI